MARTKKKTVEKIDVDKVAQRAVEKTLLTIGIDISTPEAIVRAQDNFGFLDKLNAGQKDVKKNAIRTLVGAAVTGALAYLTIAFGMGGGSVPAH